jgi:hypothetical protein
MKASFEALKMYHIKMGHRATDRNMRETWTLAHDYMTGFGDPGNRSWQRFESEYHALIEQFERDGQVFYHAKKHGVQSAVLLRLTLA